MDKAPDFGSGDCRFESCHGRKGAPKFLDALKVVSKLLASDQKIERSWMLPMLLNCMSQYHLKFLEYSIKKYDAISSKVTGVIDVTRAPKFLGALKVVFKLVASDRKIGRSWMLVKFLNFDL